MWPGWPRAEPQPIAGTPHRRRRWVVVVDTLINPERYRTGRQHSVESLLIKVVTTLIADRARAAVGAR